MMKLSRLLASAIAVAFITTTAAFAAPDAVNSTNKNTQNLNVEKKDKNEIKKDKLERDFLRPGKNEDPIKALQDRKEKIQLLLKEGRISREEADAITAKIDARIKKIEEFNKLTPQQKKDKLRNDFRMHMDKKLKDGRITKDKANEIIKKFEEKLEKWDGKGYPRFFKKDMKFNKHHGLNRNIDKAAG